MSSNATLIGYTEEQHRRLSAVVLQVETLTGTDIGVPRKKRPPSQPTAARVMIIDESYPVYSPRVARQVAVFVHDPTAAVITVEMSGDDLYGFLELTIDGTSYVVDCQWDTSALQAALGFAPTVVRVRVFPGMWEFVFLTVESPPVVTVEPYYNNSSIFSGGALVIREGWLSLDDGENGFETLACFDAMPFLEGELKRGSRAIAHWESSSGWLAGEWKCRDFRFRPLIDAGSGGGDGSGGDGSGGNGSGGPILGDPGGDPEPEGGP